MILPSEIENNVKSFSNFLEVACVKKTASYMEKILICLLI